MNHLTRALLWSAGLTLLLVAGVMPFARPSAEARTDDEPVPILVELTDPPVAAVYAEARARSSEAAATAQAQAHLRRVDAAQRTLLAAAPLAGSRTLYRTQRVYNGIALLVDPERIGAIKALPGVAEVHALPLYTVALGRTVPFLGIPRLWDAVYADGITGETVSIGFIDTGIDYLHTDFGGPGRGYDHNDPTVITDTPGGVTFPTAKVVGGYDFAGDDYDARPGHNPIPNPDPDPMDCWGHGTHVAGIAGGLGVLTNGQSYTGTYTEELDLNRFLIGPGAAPRARLYALKIFGCTGSSNLANLALEWAVDPNSDGDFSDHLDVVNMSIGSPFGAPDDPTVVAINNAARAGVVVVAAGGNSGDTFYITTAPGVADRAISVASSSVSGLPVGARPGDEPVNGVDHISSFSSRGPRRGDAALKPDITAPGSHVTSAAAGTGNRPATFSGTSMATPHVAGVAALLRQVHPGWSVEEIKALLIDTARYNLRATDNFPPLIYGAGRVGAGRLDAANALVADVLAYNASDPGQVSLSFGTPAVLGETLALKNVRIANQSALTRTLFLRYRPVVDNPGVNFALTGNPTLRLGPFDSRNVALVFSAEAGKLAYVADPTVARRLRFPRHWLSEETGYLQVWPAVTHFTARLSGANEIPPLSSPLTGVVTLDLEPATGILSYTLTLSHTGTVTPTAAHLQMGSFLVNGPVIAPLATEGLTGTGAIRVSGVVTVSAETADRMAAGYVYVNLVSVENPEGAARGQVEPEEGMVRLPVYVAPRPAAAMRARQAFLDFGDRRVATATVELVGQGLLSQETLAAGRFPTDTVSVVSAFELQFSSPNEPTSTGSREHADLEYIGVASDYRSRVRAKTPPGRVADARVLFAIATYGEWSTPNEVTFAVYIDTDEDGKSDYRVYTGNFGDFGGVGPSDEFFSIVEDLKTGNSTLAYFLDLVSSAELNTALFDNNVLLLAVDASALGLSEANSDFRYYVTTQSMDTETSNQIVDLTPRLSYDVRRPGLDATGAGLGGFPIFYDLPGTQIPVRFDRDAFRAHHSQGLLLLHHHNELGARAEVVSVRSFELLYLPVIGVGR